MSLNTKVIEALQMYHSLMRDAQGMSTSKTVYGTSAMPTQPTQVNIDKCNM